MTLQHNGAFGDYLRRFRERAGLTQAALAEKAGLTPNAISALERGDRRQPYPHTIHALSEALDLVPQERAELLAVRYGNRKHVSPMPEASQPALSPTTIQAQHNLPVEVSSFVGRQAEMTQVKRLLGAHRLVTMTGAGGSGKTRLALAVANDVAADYADGVWLAQLADIADPALVPDAIARTLNVRGESGVDTISTIIEALRHREMLLLVDNCEHVIGVCAALVERLLAACPRLTICTTSREVLRVSGEYVYLVPTLPAPNPDLVLQLDQLRSYDAVHLFLERAIAHQPTFVLNDSNARAVADICWRLDGIPLAVELAAARIRSMTPQQVVERLHNSLRLLTGGSRTALPRQQTLRATLDWSYNLLDAPHRQLFRQLSVFVGGWELDAAEVVGANYDPGSVPVADALDRLVEQSLVVAEVGNRHGPARYRMLEPVRQYALQLLEESGEATEVRRRHAAVYLLLAERAHPELRRGQQVVWLHTIGQEHDNMRAALAWSLRHNEFETVARIGWALWPFWWIRNQHREGRRWTDAARAHEKSLPPLLFRRVTMAAAAMAYGQADDQTVEHYMSELIRLSHECGGDPHAEAYAYSGFGLVAVNRGQFAPALQHLETARRLLEQSGEAGMAAQALTWIGTVLLLTGEYAAARQRFEAGLIAGRAIGDRLAITNALFNLAQMALATGNYASATDYLCQGIPLSQEMDDRGNIAFILEGLAIAATATAQYERGATLFGAAECIIERLGLRGHTYYQPDRAMMEQATTTLREQLGETAYTSIHTAGQAMSFEQAVAYAQESPSTGART